MTAHPNDGIAAPLNALAKLASDCKVPVVVADAAMEDTPIVVANQAFCDMTGYQASEVLGRNCRFLQPNEAANLSRERIRAFLADDAQPQGEFVLPNRRKDGSRFLNLLHLLKITHPDRADLVVGSQFDITTQTESDLLDYSASLTHHLDLIAQLMKSEGWQMDPVHIALENSLARISGRAD